METNKCVICGIIDHEIPLIKMKSKNPLCINTYDTRLSFSCPEFCEFYICKNCFDILKDL